MSQEGAVRERFSGRGGDCGRRGDGHFYRPAFPGNNRGPSLAYSVGGCWWSLSLCAWASREMSFEWRQMDRGEGEGWRSRFRADRRGGSSRI